MEIDSLCRLGMCRPQLDHEKTYLVNRRFYPKPHIRVVAMSIVCMTIIYISVALLTVSLFCSNAWDTEA